MRVVGKRAMSATHKSFRHRSTTVGGAGQILGMMVLYPLLRNKLSNTTIFKTSLIMAITGYMCLLLSCIANLAHVLPLLCAIGLLVFVSNGMLSVLTTVFLSSSVDYGEIKTGRREESVIFSMQTFVVKAASGLAVFMTGIGLDCIHLNGNSEDGIAGFFIYRRKKMVGVFVPYIHIGVSLKNSFFVWIGIEMIISISVKVISIQKFLRDML